jgi:alpha-glucosidase (family GH31 glycosyl hydrolase)
MKKTVLLSAIVLCAALCDARPVWKDPMPIGKNSAIWKFSDADELRVDVLAQNLFRVRRSWTNCWTESGMNRYGVLKREWPETAFTRSGDTLKTAAAEVTVDAKEGTLRLKSLSSAADLTIAAENAGKGYSIRFPLAAGERMYGLGDVSRENIQRRGRRYEIWVKNVNSYIPMPMIVSSKGWGLLMNTTWRNYFDVGEKDKDALICEAPEGDVDFYVFTGKDYKELLDIYTQLSGRPQMLPAFGYGFTFVANQFIDQFNLVRDCYEFRKIDFPCDVIGLEPGWMEKFYDFSTRKTWNPRLFTFPSWSKARGMTWIGALNRIGFKLSLWLCFNYDLYRYEEQ